ncbi:Tat pathway signal protein [Streptomyces spectabilis]|uniref:Tat pathway signal protein n=1 Tax=Streptomyces spectabilis TaxID=68270 RepID=A0A516R153_STRST|nr:Tat pathway signal protein [Streptomyces spectabilis]QDQ09389.1 Tat pathway signal protein [Streptomyces spectabilis]
MARSDVSARVPNQDLADWLAEHSLTEAEFADRINLQVAALTGRPGNATDRTVRRWLSGEVRWPQAKQREALTRLTGRSPQDLGFTPRSTAPPPRAALSQGQHSRVGVSDVRRLAASLTGIVAADDRYGGTTAVEDRAVHLAREVLALQQHGSASGRVRNMLYSLAAASMCSALWAATEGHRLDAAHRHLHESLTLAGLSADPAVQFRVWGSAAVLYRRCGRGTDALAATDVTRSLPIVRRDPVYASLAHAHTAAQYATLGDRAAVQRGIDHAQSALGRAEPTRPRPSWMLFHDEAQLEFFALIAQSHLGQWAQAEAHAHRALALLRPDLVRNRHRTLLFLARAQLQQGDLEAAVASVHAVPREAWHGRTGRLVTAFRTSLTAIDARMWPTGR